MAANLTPIEPQIAPPDAGDGTSSVVVNRSPWQILWLKLRRNRAAMTALWVLVALYGLAILAGFVAPYTYDTQDSYRSFHPPHILGRIHIRDSEGNWRRPFIYESRISDPYNKVYAEDTSKIYPIRFFVQGAQYDLLWVLPVRTHLFGVDEPGRLYLFGGDQFGHVSEDQFQPAGDFSAVGLKAARV